MAFEPRAPIVVADRGDLDVFESVQDALHYVEPADVSESLEAFDAEGRRLEIRAKGVTRTRFTVGGGAVFLDHDASGEPAPDVLEARLRGYINAVGPERFAWNEETLAAASLQELIAAVANSQRRARVRRGRTRWWARRR